MEWSLCHETLAVLQAVPFSQMHESDEQAPHVLISASEARKLMARVKHQR